MDTSLEQLIRDHITTGSPAPTGSSLEWMRALQRRVLADQALHARDPLRTGGPASQDPSTLRMAGQGALEGLNFLTGGTLQAGADLRNPETRVGALRTIGINAALAGLGGAVSRIAQPEASFLPRDYVPHEPLDQATFLRHAGDLAYSPAPNLSARAVMEGHASRIATTMPEPALGEDVLAARERRRAARATAPQAGPLPATWGIVTGENPGGSAVDAATNARLHAEAGTRLDILGKPKIEMTGAYTDAGTGQLLHEKSWFVPGLGADDAMRLNSALGQSSSLTHEGMRDLATGKMTPIRNIEHGVPAQAPYSELAGGRRFRVNLEKSIAQLGQEYRAKNGLSEARLPEVQSVDQAAGKKMAEAYAALPNNPNDPNVRAAYDAFTAETEAQAKHLRDEGYTMSKVSAKDYPYKSHEDMLKDLHENKHVTIMRTADEPGNSTHPLLTNDQNDTFRWVHDIKGHGEGDYSFTPENEENAYRAHAPSYSPLARQAMAMETRGQNSMLNYGPHAAGAAAGKPVFPEQKAALWPQHLMGDYPSMAEPPAPRFLSALRLPDGQMFIAPTHYQALENAKAAGKWTERGGGAEEGFIDPTNPKKFLTRGETEAMMGLEPTKFGLGSEDVLGASPRSHAARLRSAAERQNMERNTSPTAKSQLMPRGEVTSLGHALAHHLGGGASALPDWLNNVRQENPLLGKMLDADPKLAERIHKAASVHLDFVNDLQPYENIRQLAEAGGPGWDEWYGPYVKALRSAGLPEDVVQRVLHTSSILSTRKAPVDEVLTALQTWQAHELGQPITTATTQHTNALTEAATNAIRGEPWAGGVKPEDFKLGTRQKTSNYVLSENTAGQGVAPTLDTHHMRAYLGKNLEKYTDAKGNLKLTPAQLAVLQSRTASDAMRYGVPTGDFQARVWGGQTGYTPSFGAEGANRADWLAHHLSSGNFQPLIEKYPGLEGLAERGGIQNEGIGEAADRQSQLSLWQMLSQGLGPTKSFFGR